MSEDNKTDIFAWFSKNPLAALLLIIMLGGQGADVLFGQQTTMSVSQTNDEILDILNVVRDNSQRIERLEIRANNVDDRFIQLSEQLEDVSDLRDVILNYLQDKNEEQ
jgi:hypothetical protein